MPTNDLASESSPPEVPDAPLRFRHPSPSDGASMHSLAASVGLDLNSPYAYLMWADHFSATSLVAERGDGRAPDAATADGGSSAVGMLLGFLVPRRPDTLFVWQVGVGDEARGRGVASQMLDLLLDELGVSWLEATVTPDNEASAALFRSVATSRGATVDEHVAYEASQFPGEHEAEVLFRVGPLHGPVVPRPPRARRSGRATTDPR